MDSFYTEAELRGLGLKSYGNNVKISRYSRIYSPELIQIGNNVRIDDFTILSGNISLGSNIHISAFVALYGKFGVFLEDYTGISPHSIIFSAMDDFSGNYLIGPIHKPFQTNVHGGTVLLRRFSQIGCSCVVFPNVTIGEGVAVGALSLVNKSLEEWNIYAGVPVKKIRKRSKKLQKLL